jgi:hypothetical protein
MKNTMFKLVLVLFSGFALMCITPTTTHGEGDKFLTFDYFLKAIPEPPVLKLLDTADGYTTNGIWCFKPNLSISALTFNRDGTPTPFSAIGLGISYQREVNVAFKNKTTFEIGASYVLMNSAEYGPALTVGAFDGLFAGGAYGIKSKHFYALLGYGLTINK